MPVLFLCAAILLQQQTYTFPDSDDTSPFTVTLPPHFKAIKNTRPVPSGPNAISDGKTFFGASLVEDKGITKANILSSLAAAKKLPVTKTARKITTFNPPQGGLAWWMTTNMERVAVAHKKKQQLSRWVGWIHGQIFVKNGQMMDFDFVRWDSNITPADHETLKALLGSIKTTVPPKKSAPGKPKAKP